MVLVESILPSAAFLMAVSVLPATMNSQTGNSVLMGKYTVYFSAHI